MTIKTMILVAACATAVSCAFGAPDDDDCQWIDGATLYCEGRGYDVRDEPYVRIPKSFEGKVPKSVYGMGRQSTGLNIRFRTSSRKLVFRWTVAASGWSDPLICPSGLDSIAVWGRGEGDADWEFLAKAHPKRDGRNRLQTRWDPAKTCLVYLPMRAVVQKFEIGLEKGATFEVLARDPKDRIVHYGTSIVHGGCVSQPGLMFTAFEGRMLDREVVNLGFSGAGKMEPEMADFIGGIDAALYVVDCDWNMNAELQKQNYEAFVRRLHGLKPGTPILLCGGCTERRTPRTLEVYARSVFDRLKAENPALWKNLHFFSGVGQLPFESFATHDHCHPNDYGAPFMGRAYAAAIAPILGQPGGKGAGGTPLLSMTVLNTDCMSGGVGQCCVFRTASGKTYLYDTGNAEPHKPELKKNNGRDIVIPWLRRHGIEKIDGLIISHYHTDHFGGFLHMLDHFPIERVYDNSFVPDGADDMDQWTKDELKFAKDALAKWEKAHPGRLVTHTREGTPLGWDEPGIRFEVVWPPKDAYVTYIPRKDNVDAKYHDYLNSNATGLKVYAGDVSYFVLGDINARFVTQCMRPYMEKKGTWTCDVAVLPAHGTGNRAEDVLAMRPLPQVAVAAQGNIPWVVKAGRQCLADYVDGGILRTYVTNIHGDVTVETDGRTLTVATDPNALMKYDPK